MSYPQQPPNPSAYPSGAPGHPETQRRRKTVLAVVLAVVGVLVITLAGVAIASAGGDDGDSASGVAGGPGSSTAEPTPTETETEPAPVPSPTESESEDPAPAPATGKLKASEYDKDWDFKLGDVALKAKHKAGWDYATCAPVAKGGKLKQLGCKYAVEVTYTALGGKLQFTHLFLTLPSAAAASKAVSQDKLTDSDFAIRDESFVPDYKLGKYRDNSGGAWVVVTVATAKAGVSEKKLEDYLKYSNTDFSSALLFRF